MVLTDATPFASAFPADDEAEDARWLACLIAALRNHAERQGHPEMAVALHDALAAAQALARGGKPH